MIALLAGIGPLITRYAIAAAAAFAVMGWMYHATVQRGVIKERQRVETAGRKINGKAKVARAKAENSVGKSNDVTNALKSWCRDCD
jgi:hydroxypyruvate isomerase